MEEFRDLIYGQGEWKNMQEVIRKTFHLFASKMTRLSFFFLFEGDSSAKQMKEELR
jgi:hypothetical protein